MGKDFLSKKTMNRRSMLKKSAGLAGLSLAGFGIDRVNAFSRPSKIRITDIRACTVASEFDYPIIRIDTNQDIYGLGEVRDAGLKGQALILKPFIVGRDPTDIEGILGSIKQYAGHGRLGGGYNAIDMALFDLNGKIFDVPAYRLLGSKRRDRIWLYCATDARYATRDIHTYVRLSKKRVEDGFTYFKTNYSISMIRNIPGAMVGSSPTDKGIKAWAENYAVIREDLGYDVLVGADHFGRLSVNDCIRLARALEPYKPAWLEDMVPWRNTEGQKRITETILIPTLNGENIFGLEGFKDLIDQRAVDIIHPDLLTSGGILETKLIADRAAENGISTCIHNASSPIGVMAAVHCAATMSNFDSLECHSEHIPWWGDLVTGVEKPIVSNGHIKVPNGPGLGVELNEDVVKEHLREPGYFEPTPEFDKPIIGGSRGGPYPHIGVDGTLVNNRE